MRKPEDQASTAQDHTRPTQLQLTLIAARAMVDRRTVNRFLKGKRGASTTGARIAQALVDLNLQHLKATQA